MIVCIFLFPVIFVSGQNRPHDPLFSTSHIVYFHQLTFLAKNVITSQVKSDGYLNKPRIFTVCRIERHVTKQLSYHGANNQGECVSNCRCDANKLRSVLLTCTRATYSETFTERQHFIGTCKRRYSGIDM